MAAKGKAKTRAIDLATRLLVRLNRARSDVERGAASGAAGREELLSTFDELLAMAEELRREASAAARVEPEEHVLFSVAGGLFSLPIARSGGVRELESVVGEGQKEIRLGEETLPLVSLRAALRAGGAATSARGRCVVIGESGKGRIALLCDEFHGREELFPKPLGGYAGAFLGVKSAGMTRDGRIALTVDVDWIAREILGR